MLVIDIELLTGRYVATAFNDRDRAEWPPHPARFYSALVAALHDREPIDDTERQVLVWLEQQPSPALDVDPTAGRRAVLEVFVPVNDVSLLPDGDLERSLREARDAVAAITAAKVTSSSKNELKKAANKAAAEEGRLSKLFAQQQTIPVTPTKTDLAAAAALLPDRRTRQVRTFPVAIPEHPRFSFIWSEDPSPVLRAALDRLCERVTRLGHSSSLVSCALSNRAAIPTLVPDLEGEDVLRTVGPGQLERLIREFGRHQAVEARVLPARPQRYASPHSTLANTSPPHSVFSDEWIVFERVGGAQPLSSRGTDLTRALRRAIIEQCDLRSLPASLSGHREDGGPAEQPHLAFVALPFVDHQHADASVKGCAVVLPRNLAKSDREALLRLVAAWEQERAIDNDGTMELAAGNTPPVRLRRVELSAALSLRPRRWSRSAKRFITVTPIALDRNPGNLRNNKQALAHKASIEAQKSVATACKRIGLPAPISVEVSLAPLLAGVLPVRAFLPWPDRPGRTARVQVHADICFDQPIRGPLLVGAGRFFGLGLCLPIEEVGSH